MKKLLFKSFIFTLIVRCILVLSILYFESSLTDFLTEFIVLPFEVCIFAALYFVAKGKTDKSWHYIIATSIFNAIFGGVCWFVLEQILGGSLKLTNDEYLSLELSISAFFATVLTIDAVRTVYKSLEKSQRKIPKQTSKLCRFLKKSVLECFVYALIVRMVLIGLLYGAEYIDNFDFSVYVLFLRVFICTILPVLFTFVYFALKGKNNHQWAYILVMVVSQVVLFLIALMVTNYVSKEYPRSSITLIIGICEYLANSIFASILMIDVVRTRIMSSKKYLAEECKCQKEDSSTVVDTE